MKKILFFILVTLPMVVFGQEDVTLFMISESYGRYSITIFYENGYNMANGENL